MTTFITGCSFSFEDELIENKWIDFGTQAVILEFLVYSPSSFLVSAGAMLGEWSNFGSFVPSHEFVVVTEYFLTPEINWTTILLIFYFLGFLFEEIRDYTLSWRASSIQEREDAIQCNRYCAQFYLYLSSWWNIMDVVMVSSGLCYIILQYYTAQSKY